MQLEKNLAAQEAEGRGISTCGGAGILNAFVQNRGNNTQSMAVSLGTMALQWHENWNLDRKQLRYIGIGGMSPLETAIFWKDL